MGMGDSSASACGIGAEGATLVRDGRGLALVGGGMELRGDFAHLLPRLVPGKLERELLVRAAKVKGASAPVVVDATAGLGEDALLLAQAGFTVLMYERDPAVSALLRDALARAEEIPELAGAVSRMRLFEEDSLCALPQLSAPPDVVYLDPMFPARSKSAAVKKKFQLLHQLVRPCGEDEARLLLRAAIAAAPRKVVVKRPTCGPHLADIQPSYSLAGKSVRYDVIVPANLKGT